MIKLYFTPGCSGAKKVKKFLNDNNIEFKEKDITKQQLTKTELNDIISLTENGFEDIVSTNSDLYKEYGEEFFDNLTTNKLSDFIIANPTILRRPIVVQYDNSCRPSRLIVGFNTQNIGILLRENKRIVELFNEECSRCQHHDNDNCCIRRKFNDILQEISAKIRRDKETCH